jgi:tetratricopeptide (TPR) repeat protein
MKKACLLLFFLPAYFFATAQSTYYVDSLHKQLYHSSTVPTRMYWLNELARYYTGIDSSLSEAFGGQIIAIADSSRNRQWMINAFLYNAYRFYDFGFVQQSITRGLNYSQKAFDIAKSNHLDEYTSWAYMALARGYRSNGENEKALNCSNMAMSLASAIDNDSLKAYVYNSLARTYLARNEKLLAFRNCLNALSIAEASGKYDLLLISYNLMSDFYRSLSDIEKAKDFQFKKAALQRQQHRLYDLLETWQAIGNLYNSQKEADLGLSYLQKAIALADSLHIETYKTNIFLSIINLYLNCGMYEKGVAYYNTHTEMKDFLNKAGMSYFNDYLYGILYVFANKLDSAEYYLKKSEPYILTRANKNNKYEFYSITGTYYRKKNDYEKVLNYWLKAKDMAEQMGSLYLLQEAVNNLDSAYQFMGDYKNAYTYNSLYHLYGDSLNALAKERDMMLLEIDNENRRKEREAKKQEEAIRRNHNLQYMGITIAIAIIFILLVAAGVFKVSKTTISALGFFAFIFLFEFIILIADNKIHDFTHGEPWKVLAIKIGLIAILLPLHHKLEEKVIHYLTTKELKGRGFFKKLRKKKDADVPMGNV